MAIAERFASDRSSQGIGRTLAAFALVALVASRLVLTGDRDILAVNQPYDDYWFVAAVLRDLWSGPYDHMTFAQLQVFALWLKAVNLLGLPARLAIDVLWIAGAAWCGSALARFCERRWVGALCFVFLAFHPYSIALFDRALSENLTTCLTTIVIAGLLDVWNHRRDGVRPSRARRWASAIVAALAFALAYHSRKEGIVLLIPLLALTAWSAVDRKAWWAGPARIGTPFILLPIVATLVLGVTLAGLNKLAWGVFARYELAAPNYVRAVAALNAIDPGGPTPRYVTVTAATRAKAYAVSPTFRELQGFLDGPALKSVVAETDSSGYSRGEIGNAWFYWTLRDAARATGWHVSARAAEAKYGAMSDEISRAFEDGRLTRRAVPLAFVDPQWRKWLPLLPGAFLTELRETFLPAPSDLIAAPESATAFQQDAYVTATGRRVPFVRAGFSGWVIAPPGSAVGLGVRDAESWTVLGGATRPDVPGAFPVRLTASMHPREAALWIRTPDGASTSIALTGFVKGRMYPVAALPGTIVGVDDVQDAPPPPRADRWLVDLCRVWSAVGGFFALAGLVALVPAATARTAPRGAFVLLAASFVAILARSALIAIVDTSSWSGAQARYLLPVVPFVAVLGATGCAVLWTAVQDRRPR